MELVGLLEAQETPSGTVWSLYSGDFTKREWSYEFLHEIRIGDYLKILNQNRKILWEGKVKYGKTDGTKIVGFDKSLPPRQWERFFHNRHFAILIKTN